ncbi:MAG: hypothetical protein R2709_00720 [Marmoricola sp.]
MIGLVEKARGDSKHSASSDHYQPSVYRFLYYRVGSAHLAEDLTADTFFGPFAAFPPSAGRAKTSGAWVDDYRSQSLNRSLQVDGPAWRLQATTWAPLTLPSPENDVLTTLSNEEPLGAYRNCPPSSASAL